MTVIRKTNVVVNNGGIVMTKETAMKILKELHDNSLFSNRIALETLIPELADSSDERIRKCLIDFFEDWHENKSHCWGIAVTDILDWLEKQCKSSDQIHYWTEEELDQAAEEYSLGHSVRKECFIDGALWMKEKLKRNDTKD